MALVCPADGGEAPSAASRSMWRSRFAWLRHVDRRPRQDVGSASPGPSRSEVSFGVSFGLSMSIHLILILCLYCVSNFAPAEVRPVDLAIGGFGLLLIGTMLVTSLSRIRMAMPARRWKRLHRGGLYFVWFVFFACLSTSMVEKSTEAFPLSYVPFLALLLGVLALRLAASWRGARKAGSGRRGRVLALLMPGAGEAGIFLRHREPGGGDGAAQARGLETDQQQ